MRPRKLKKKKKKEREREVNIWKPCVLMETQYAESVGCQDNKSNLGNHSEHHIINTKWQLC